MCITNGNDVHRSLHSKRCHMTREGTLGHYAAPKTNELQRRTSIGNYCHQRLSVKNILTASTNHWLTQTTSKECPPKLDRGAFFFRPVTAGSVFTLDPSIHTYIVLSGSCGLALGHFSFFLPSLSFSILA